MKRLLKFKDPTLRSGERNDGENKPTNGTKNTTPPQTPFRRRDDRGNFKHTLQDPTLRSGGRNHGENTK